MSPSALEIRGLRKAYPEFRLGPLDLTVPAGAIYGFVGPNGAGKTTTIDLILGMGSKDAGIITVLGCDHLRDEVAVKRQVGYVSPDLDFRPWRRVRNAIRFVRGFHTTWDEPYCQRLLQAFRLSADQKIDEFSFGARIKLAIVLALSSKPKLLILDEPTAGLDAISRQQVFAELLSAVRDGERSVFISSHAITDLERFADYVGMIKQGRMLLEGATSDVVERYRMVDFEADETSTVADAPGVYVQQKDHRRWRAVLDIHAAPLEWLKSRGATPIAESRLSLEELFVALGRD